MEEWLPKDTISGNYVEAKVSEVLRNVLKNTVINFYILDESSIILTQNKRVYDKLPNTFFGRKEGGLDNRIVDVVDDTEPLVFMDDNISGQTAKVGTVFVGNSVGATTDDFGYYDIWLPRGENLLETRSLGIENQRNKVIPDPNIEYDYPGKYDNIGRRPACRFTIALYRTRQFYYRAAIRHACKAICNI